MPTTIEGTNVFQSSGVLLRPARRPNAGGRCNVGARDDAEQHASSVDV